MTVSYKPRNFIEITNQNLVTCSSVYCTFLKQLSLDIYLLSLLGTSKHIKFKDTQPLSSNTDRDLLTLTFFYYLAEL